MDFIIDIQAFHDKEGLFLPKEIAVIAADRNFIAHWIVKPPCDYSELPKGIISTNSYLSCYHHGIEWYDGEATLEDVYPSLRYIARDAHTIYTRGYQKANLLERILGRQITNLEEYSCPTFKNLSNVDDHICMYHGGKSEHLTCALAYTFRVRAWLRKALYGHTEIDMNEQRKKKNYPNEKHPRALVDGVASSASSSSSSSSGSSVAPRKISVNSKITTSGTPAEVIESCLKSVIVGEEEKAVATSHARGDGDGSGGGVKSKREGEAAEEPYYSKPYDELTTDSAGSERHIRTDRRGFSSRSVTPGVDETGRYYC